MSCVDHTSKTLDENSFSLVKDKREQVTCFGAYLVIQFQPVQMEGEINISVWFFSFHMRLLYLCSMLLICVIIDFQHSNQDRALLSATKVQPKAMLFILYTKASHQIQKKNKMKKLEAIHYLSNYTIVRRAQ